MAQIWRVGTGEAVVQSLADLREVLLQQRGVGASDLESFFSPQYEASIHAPELLAGTAAAAQRLTRAARDGERVLVYGDYDADGITATAILVTVLRDLGIPVIPYLPHRMDDGYGLNQTVLAPLLREFDVLIAADCGISNAKEIAWLRSEGKDVLIVDHHELPGELPEATAILHPRLRQGYGGQAQLYPFPHLCGAGVAWKLAQAIDDTRARELLDLAALGTIADVVSMTGENRAIVRFGLQIMSRRKRVGLAALLATGRVGERGEITAQDLAFRVIPRLNAAGRMEHPQPALDLLLASDARRAQELVLQLNSYNTARQTLTRRILSEATTSVDETLPFVFAANVSWPAGIVGLVAGRLAEKYQRPAVVVGGNGSQAVGSARAGPGGNVLSLLEHGREYLMKFGGHARAAGFSLAAERISHFQRALLQVEHAGGGEMKVAGVADAAISADLLTWDLLELTEQFAPYGEGNAEPTFMVRRLAILDERRVGKTKEHLKLTLAGVGEGLEAIGFGLGQMARIGKHIDALFTIGVNEYGSRRRLELRLKDIAPAGTVSVQGKDAGNALH